MTAVDRCDSNCGVDDVVGAAAWRQATFQADVVDATATEGDWFGERTEDTARHSIVTEPRPFYDRRQQQTAASAAASHQPLNDHITFDHSPPASTPHMYVDDASIL